MQNAQKTPSVLQKPESFLKVKSHDEDENMKTQQTQSSKLYRKCLYAFLFHSRRVLGLSQIKPLAGEEGKNHSEEARFGKDRMHVRYVK